MKLLFNPRKAFLALLAATSLMSLCGCSTIGGPAADLGLAGAGGVAGYHLSDGKVGGAAAGAVVGYAASRIAQAQVHRELSEAEQRGYDRALNQAVKQQYWIIQEQQKSRNAAEESDARLIPVVIPETKINGVLVQAHVEYIRVQ
jgi:hypothetical protein